MLPSASRDLAAKLDRSIHRLVGLHHAIDEAKLLGLVRPTMSPKSSISIAALRERLRVSATIGVEQKREISVTPGVAKRASWLATARSQVAASWQPAAVAIPFTAAITGFGERTIDSIILEQASMILAK